jgi:hypothetical protein
MPGGDQPRHDAGAHGAEADETDLHPFTSRVELSRVRMMAPNALERQSAHVLQAW